MKIEINDEPDNIYDDLNRPTRVRPTRRKIYIDGEEQPRDTRVTVNNRYDTGLSVLLNDEPVSPPVEVWRDGVMVWKTA